MSKEKEFVDTTAGTTGTVLVPAGPSDRTRYPWEPETGPIEPNPHVEPKLNREERRKAKKHGKV